jgi:hypothetical protein
MSAYKSLSHLGCIGAFDLYLYLNLEKKKKREGGYKGEINTQVYPENECTNAPLAIYAYFRIGFRVHSGCTPMHPGRAGMHHAAKLPLEAAWAA